MGVFLEVGGTAVGAGDPLGVLPPVKTPSRTVKAKKMLMNVFFDTLNLLANLERMFRMTSRFRSWPSLPLLFRVDQSGLAIKVGLLKEECVFEEMGESVMAAAFLTRETDFAWKPIDSGRWSNATATRKNDRCRWNPIFARPKIILWLEMNLCNSDDAYKASCSGGCNSAVARTLDPSSLVEIFAEEPMAWPRKNSLSESDDVCCCKMTSAISIRDRVSTQSSSTRMLPIQSSMAMIDSWKMQME